MQSNSGDTKGIVLDDWTTVNWQKVQLLQKLTDLSPWYGIPASVSGAAIESAEGTSTTTVATRPFPVPARGIVWDLASLASGDSKLNGDFATVLQRTLALGFDTILVPFGFNDLESDGYLADLNHSCAPTNNTQLRASVLPANISAITVTAVGLPVINGVPLNITTNTCNDFIAGSYGKERFLYLVRAMVETGVRVVLQNTDAYAAQVAPDQWLLRWVDLAADLQIVLGDMTDMIVVDLLNAVQSPMQWVSIASRPGLSELYRTALPTLYPLLPNSVYFVEGVNGSDFSTSDFYFKNLLTEPWEFQVVPFAANDPFGTLNNLTSSLEYIGSPGICLTSDNCQSLQYAVEIPQIDSNFTPEETGILSSDTWILNQDPSIITADMIQPLNSLGLRPWYYPRSGYSPIVVPAIIPGSSAEAAEFTSSACSTIVTVNDYDDTSTFPTNAVLNIQITNLQATTLFPPWTLDINDQSISGLLYSFDGSLLRSTDGLVSISFGDYYSVLWPSAINSFNTTVILEVQPPVLTNLTLSTNGQVCSTIVSFLNNTII